MSRLVEEVKQKCHVELQNEDVYMATTYEAFIQKIARKGRGLDDQVFEYDAVRATLLFSFSCISVINQDFLQVLMLKGLNFLHFKLILSHSVLL